MNVNRSKRLLQRKRTFSRHIESPQSLLSYTSNNFVELVVINDSLQMTLPSAIVKKPSSKQQRTMADTDNSNYEGFTGFAFEMEFDEHEQTSDRSPLPAEQRGCHPNIICTHAQPAAVAHGCNQHYELSSWDHKTESMETVRSLQPPTQAWCRLNSMAKISWNF